MEQNKTGSPSALKRDGTVAFRELYSADRRDAETERYRRLAQRFHSMFGMENPRFFSVPGRSELSGNHTDHNNGRVLACAVDLDLIAAAAPSGDNRVIVASEGFDPDVVELTALSPLPEEHGRSSALVRGVLARLKQQGCRVGGFRATTASRVLKGSGLSSSAAYEVMVAELVSRLFNDGKIDPLTMAKAGQFAETTYFGKPCGLMDQTACAEGGVVTIDFADTENPAVERLSLDLHKAGYTLCIVDTRGSHADLTDDYAAIQAEMKTVARRLGHTVLRECDERAFYNAIPALRRELGDRAVLRAVHFFDENRRVARQVEALREGKFSTFLSLVVESGLSSALLLQNGYSVRRPEQQGVPLALCLAERMLAGRGAWRVHGGGFAGTVQAFVPAGLTGRFSKEMERVFGEGCCYRLSIRPYGPCEVLPDQAK